MSDPDPDAAGSAFRYHLRDLQGSDLEAVVSLEQATFSLPWPRSAFSMALQVPGVFCLGAFQPWPSPPQERLIGYVVASHVGRDMLIANLAVAARSRRHGVGRDLLHAAIERGRRLGVRVCRLEVRRSNHEAIQLYESLGFRAVAVQRDYYREPCEDAITMRLWLDDGGPDTTTVT